MKSLCYTLLSDGTSDKAFLPILDWLLKKHGFEGAINSQWADLARLRHKPKLLSDRIIKSLELYPCDVLFVHRDAEKQPRCDRVKEIKEALGKVNTTVIVPPVVCVIPVRMLEAWLLFDEIAIRKAADNPSGKSSLGLPRLRDVEDLPDPKDILCQVLRQASGFTGRRLKQFKETEREKIQRLAQLIEDFSPLSSLSAFQSLEQELEEVIAQQGW